ncbi:MAG: hypothetical protein U9N81_05855 [Bacillota bacterium]|nr:hypothetical protein [Bacillota bacterium]
MKEKSAKNNPLENLWLWILLWGLVVINLFAIFTILHGFSILLLLLSSAVFLVGIGVIFYRANKPVEEVVSNAVKQEVVQLMEEIRPVCDEVFTREVERLAGPVIEGIEEEFARSLEWLWQDTDAFLQRMNDEVSEVKSGIKMMGNINESRAKTLRMMEETIAMIQKSIQGLLDHQEEDTLALKRCTDAKAAELETAMETEKDIFYDYVQKLLVTQLSDRSQGAEALNVDRLGDQFSGVVEKSVESRLAMFEEGLIRDIENISGDIVGKMQKGTLLVLNLFREFENLIDQMFEEYRGENGLALRRLAEVRPQIASLRKEANELLVSLAWQDIMQEKRCHEIQEQLNEMRDELLNNVGEDVLEYVARIVSEQVPALEGLSVDGSGTSLFKTIMNAECVYQVYQSGQMLDTIQDGSYVLLQFLTPVEMFVNGFVEPDEARLQKRQTLKNPIKNGRFDLLWQQVQESAAAFDPVLVKGLEEVFPRDFMMFCSSARVRRSPADLNQAAWMIFMDLAENQESDTDDSMLVALLLYMHMLRNRYIHPLKSAPVSLAESDDLEVMRSCAYRSIQLLIQ